MPAPSSPITDTGAHVYDERAPDLYNVTLSLPAHFDDARMMTFAPDLGEAALAFTALREGNVHTADWTLRWLFDGKPDEDFVAAQVAPELAALGHEAAWRIEPVAAVNWLEQSYRQFQPFTVGPFFIYGSHFDGPPPAGHLPLQIDAATAFGSGEHGTTAGCLRALARLAAQGFAPSRILDMGTGSGILAIAAARLWPSQICGRVTAIDIDREAVIVTDRHAAMNGVADRIEAAAGDGFAAPAAQGPFDLVIANILAGPLIAMAGDLTASVAPGGRFILSGLLTEQAAEVAAAYETRGGALEESFVLEPWAAQLWRRA